MVASFNLQTILDLTFAIFFSSISKMYLIGIAHRLSFAWSPRFSHCIHITPTADVPFIDPPTHPLHSLNQKLVSPIIIFTPTAKSNDTGHTTATCMKVWRNPKPTSSWHWWQPCRPRCRMHALQHIAPAAGAKCSSTLTPPMAHLAGPACCG
jgi:hypothetical protein